MKLPFSWPNSVDSISSRGIEPQSSTTNGLCLRADALCSARVKVYNAYKRASEHKGGPTVILAKTVKGYGLGSEFEARNPTHQNKKMTDETITFFRKRFEIPIPDDAARDGALYGPPDSSPEIAYLHERRRVLGGYLPVRNPGTPQFKAPGPEFVDEFRAGSKEPHPSSTMAFSACSANC